MIEIGEAEKMIASVLQDERRYSHSRNVAGKMASLARFYGEPEELWLLTGLLHDIDLPETIDCLEKHGLYAREKLQGLLPEIGIRAVETHDYRVGMKPETALGEALVFADMLEIMEFIAGKETIDSCRREGNWGELLASRPGNRYHIGVIREYGEKHRGIPI